MSLVGVIVELSGDGIAAWLAQVIHEKLFRWNLPDQSVGVLAGSNPVIGGGGHHGSMDRGRFRPEACVPDLPPSNTGPLTRNGIAR